MNNHATSVVGLLLLPNLSVLKHALTVSSIKELAGASFLYVCTTITSQLLTVCIIVLGITHNKWCEALHVLS